MGQVVISDQAVDYYIYGVININCCFSSWFLHLFPHCIVEEVVLLGLQQLWPWKGGLSLSPESPELLGLGSWFLLFPTSEVPEYFQSHQFGWGAVLVQSRRSWKQSS